MVDVRDDALLVKVRMLAVEALEIRLHLDAIRDDLPMRPKLMVPRTNDVFRLLDMIDTVRDEFVKEIDAYVSDRETKRLLLQEFMNLTMRYMDVVLA